MRRMGNQEIDWKLGEGLETRERIENYKKDGKLGERLKTMRRM